MPCGFIGAAFSAVAEGAATIADIATVIATTTAIGAGGGALVSAATGGDPLKGAELGGLTGLGVGGGEVLGPLAGVGSIAGGALGGAAGGALGGKATGANPLTTAIEGGISGGISGALQVSGAPSEAGGSVGGSAGGGAGGSIAGATPVPAGIDPGIADPTALNYAPGAVSTSPLSGVVSPVAAPSPAGAVPASVDLSGGGANQFGTVGAVAPGASSISSVPAIGDQPGVTSGAAGGAPSTPDISGGAAIAPSSPLTPLSTQLASAGTSGPSAFAGPITMEGGTGGTVLSNATAGAGTGGAGGGAATGGSSLSKFLDNPSLSTAGGVLAANPGVAIGAAGLGYEALSASKAPPGINQITGEAQNLGAQGTQLASYLSTGTLPPGVQNSLNTAAASAKATIRSRYAQMGASGSSAEQEELAGVDSAVANQGVSIATNLLQQGISEQNISNQLYAELLNYSLQEDSGLGSAITNFSIAAAGGIPGLQKGA